MEAFLPFLGGIVVTSITGTVAWLVSRRQRSGRISTTEAQQLWLAAETMRKELRDEVVSLKAEVKDLREKLDIAVQERQLCKEGLEELREQAEGWRLAALREAQEHGDS